MYCVKCKKRTDTTNERVTTTKNNRHMKRGVCVICGTTKNAVYQITKRRIVVK